MYITFLFPDQNPYSNLTENFYFLKLNSTLDKIRFKCLKAGEDPCTGDQCLKSSLHLGEIIIEH